MTAMTATINNIEKISKLLVSNFCNTLEETDAFFNIQLIQRKKDTTDCEANSRLIKSINIPFKNSITDFLEEFKKMEPTILKLCHNESCRAMINLNPCSKKNMHLKFIQKLTNNLMENNLNQFPFNNKGMIQSVIDNSHISGQPKLWVLDIDTKGEEFLNKVIQFLEDHKSELNFKVESEVNIVIETIESKNGFHLITRPFNVQIFNKQFPDIEIKKHGLTNLIIL